MLSANLFTTANYDRWQFAISEGNSGILDAVRAQLQSSAEFAEQVQLEFSQLITIPALLVPNRIFNKTAPTEATPVIVCRDNGKFKGLKPEHEEAFMRAIRAGEFNRPRRVRASAIAGCPRQIWFDIMGFERVPTDTEHPEWAVINKIGTAIHAVLERTVDDSPLASRQEFNVEIEGVFGGKVDLEVKLDDQTYVLDWKTVGNKDFRKGMSLPKFKKYFAQLSSYAAVENFTKAIVVLVNRDTLELAEYHFDIFEDYSESLIAAAHDIMKHVSERRIPTTHFVGSRSCSYCEFSRLCDAQEFAGIVQRSLDDGLEPSKL